MSVHGKEPHVAEFPGALRYSISRIYTVVLGCETAEIFQSRTQFDYHSTLASEATGRWCRCDMHKGHFSIVH